MKVIVSEVAPATHPFGVILLVGVVTFRCLSIAARVMVTGVAHALRVVSTVDVWTRVNLPLPPLSRNLSFLTPFHFLTLGLLSLHSTPLLVRVLGIMEFLNCGLLLL